MDAEQKSGNSKQAARTVGLLTFVLMSLVSAVVFFTEGRLTVIDYCLLIGAPFASAILAYFVVLNHDPGMSN